MVVAQRGIAVLFGAFDIFFGLTAALLAAAVSTIGILTMAIYGNWARRRSVYFSAFAVGLLTVGVLFNLIPEAMSSSQDSGDGPLLALSWVAVGFAVMVLIGIAVQTAVSGDPDGAALTFGYASIIALAAHSFIDGAIYAVSFREGPATGWLATGGLLFHEFPEGVIAYALLIHAGLSRSQAIVLAFVAAAVTTLSGTIIANILLNLIDHLPLSALLGSAAGALIYVLIVHLGPHAAQTPNKRGYEIAALGVLVATAAVIMQHLSGSH